MLFGNGIFVTVFERLRSAKKAVSLPKKRSLDGIKKS